MTLPSQIFRLTALLILPFSLMAADNKFSRESLRGVKTFGVLVEQLDPVAVDLGLSVAELQTAVELKLRLAGIKVVSTEDSIALPGSPYLYVELSTAGKSPGIIGYNLDLAFWQQAILVREPTKFSGAAATWNAGRIGVGGSAVAVEAIKRSLSLLVDDFLNAYLAVNPK